MKYALNWDLDSIFAGGSNSPALQAELQHLQTQIHQYHQAVVAFTPNTNTEEADWQRRLRKTSLSVEPLSKL